MFTYFVYLYFYFLKVVDVQFSSYRVYAMFYCFPPLSPRSGLPPHVTDEKMLVRSRDL